MAKKAQKSYGLIYPQVLALGISLLCAFVCAEVVIGATLHPVEDSQERDQSEISDSAPGPVNIARVQSAAQRAVQEEAIKNNAAGSPPPSPLLSKGSGGMKKVRNVAGSTASDKNEMKQVRGPGAIQDDDSLSSDSEAKGNASKGKSSASKEDSF